MAVLAGEEDGTLILVGWFLGIGEGGTEEGLVEISAQAPSSGLHSHLPSPDIKGGLCLLVRGKVLRVNSRRSEGKIQHPTGLPGYL